MNASKKILGFALLALAASQTPLAAQRVTPSPFAAQRVTPGTGAPIPRLGFSSTLISGYGLYVNAVRPRSVAARIGLEVSDVILAVNGRPLTHSGSWHRAVSQAVQRGGVLHLRIRDCRTGRVVYRSVRLFHQPNFYQPPPNMNNQYHQGQNNQDPGLTIASGILQIIGAALDQRQ